jgi:hypothetical protein
MKTMKKLIAVVILPVSLLVLSAVHSQDSIGTYENPVIDSNMSFEQALDGLSRDCPLYIRNRQRLINVRYYSFDNKIHQGQLVVDKDLVNDIEFAFHEALKERFPIFSVIPVSHISFRKNGKWDDDLSMKANNTSCFNYREITNSQRISLHAYGRAIDINPVQNPYINGAVKLPANSNYNPAAGGTLTRENIIVKSLLSRGWVWGGNWSVPKDYQHLEKK